MVPSYAKGELQLYSFADGTIVHKMKAGREGLTEYVFEFMTMPVPEQPLVPDANMLSGIFQGATDVKLANCRIISNTFNTCTFYFHCESALFQQHSKGLLVRLQTSNLADVANIQRLAYTAPISGSIADRDIGHFLQRPLRDKLSSLLMGLSPGPLRRLLSYFGISAWWAFRICVLNPYVREG